MGPEWHALLAADCCDGSDEPRGVCPVNTCLDKGAAERQEVRDGVDKLRRALQLKQQHVDQEAQRRAAWGQRAAALPAELLQQQQEVERLTGENPSRLAPVIATTGAESLGLRSLCCWGPHVTKGGCVLTCVAGVQRRRGRRRRRRRRTGSASAPSRTRQRASG